jgi:hypothetical protein
MSDDPDLDAIRAYAQDTRLYIIKHTYSWNDGGTRLLPSAMVFEVTDELNRRQLEYANRVAVFLASYQTRVSAAAFKLGQLFNRNEYPDVSELQRKFNMKYVLSPVPTSGDFRVDVQNDVGEYLKKQYQQAADNRVAELMREPWERIHDSLMHVKERMEAALAYNPEEHVEAKKNAPRIFQSMIDNALELTGLMDKMNVGNDPQLTECTARIRRMFADVDIKSVRESKEIQASIKTKVDDILGTFNFGGFE